MATIRKRGARWQVQVRRLGFGAVSRSFRLKSDAETWARQMEAAADRRGLPPDRKALAHITVADLLTRYRDTITVRKRGREQETGRINLMLRHRLARQSLLNVEPTLFAKYRDERLRTLKSETVRRELSLIQHVFAVAIREWDVPLADNPVASIAKPPSDKPRDRRLHDGEWEILIGAAERARNKLMAPLIRLAVETGMRRGELVGIRWDGVDLERRTLHLPDSKNGHPRTVPLSSTAVAILRALEPENDTCADHPVFPLTTNAVKLAWQRITKRAGIADLHFHDLRHEAISRFFERSLSVPEVALISGHRDFRMLFRYTHMRAEDV